MPVPPAQTIRNYLDEHGGEAEVPFQNLLTTWGMRGDRPRHTGDDRERAHRGRHHCRARVLQWVDPDTRVTLQVAPAAAPAPPPWAGPPPAPGAGGADETRGPRSDHRTCLRPGLCWRRAARSGVTCSGVTPGPTSEAARAQGVRQGERLAAQRQDPAGLRRARAAGRRQGLPPRLPACLRQRERAQCPRRRAQELRGRAQQRDAHAHQGARRGRRVAAAALALVRSCQNCGGRLPGL